MIIARIIFILALYAFRSLIDPPVGAGLARDWRQGLDLLYLQLRGCANNRGHGPLLQLQPAWIKTPESIKSLYFYDKQNQSKTCASVSHCKCHHQPIDYFDALITIEKLLCKSVGINEWKRRKCKPSFAQLPI
jgi:hypothetical protein